MAADRAVGAVTPVVDARVRVPPALYPDDVLGSGAYDRYDDVLGVSRHAGLDVDALITEMDEAGVDRAFLHAEYETGDLADALNEAVVELVAAHPGRFSGFGTVSLARPAPMAMVRQVERVAAAGLVGLNIQPAFFGVDVDAPELYPVYARASDLGLVVCLHTGTNYTRSAPIGHEHPLRLDRVLGHFPELRVVAGHAGWPWAAEMVALARRHPTLYLDFGGLAPKYVVRPGTGWDVLFACLGTLLAEQVLYASDWPVMPMARVLGEWAAAGLDEAVLAALLGGNAARLVPAA